MSTCLSISRVTNRQAIARQRAGRARRALSSCRLCACECGVNRLAGERGVCHAGAEARFFSAQLDLAEDIAPAFAIALSGCDLRCRFCITRPESWNAAAGQPFDAAQLSERASAALAEGARSIMILGGEPTIHLPAVLDFVASMPEAAPLAWKTNAHLSEQARELLAGMFDVWVADYKFGNDECARRLAGVPDYTRIIQHNLLWAQTETRLIVRHLLMPGHLECCWRPIAEWLAENLPQVEVSLRTGFWPMRAGGVRLGLQRCNSNAEAESAFELGMELGLTVL